MARHWRALPLLLLILLAGCGVTATEEPAYTGTPLEAGSSPTWAAADFPAGPGIGSSWVRPTDGMAMVYVPQGEFTMGIDPEQELLICQTFREDCSISPFTGDGPPFPVTLEAYWIDRTEVTNGMYAACVEAGACQPPRLAGPALRSDYYGNPEYADYPVTFVTWHDAHAYCTWSGARLPTEAEWEKAARGPQGNPYPWGDEPPDCSRANYWADTLCNGLPVAAGSFPDGASPYGALDMAGNVAEWVNSAMIFYPYEAANTRADPGSQGFFVVRGGTWYSGGYGLLAAHRHSMDSNVAVNSIGFRCALSQP